MRANKKIIRIHPLCLRVQRADGTLRVSRVQKDVQGRQVCLVTVETNAFEEAVIAPRHMI